MIEIVTSENLAEFNAARMRTTPEPAPAAVDADQVEALDDAPETEAVPEPKRAGNPKIEKRFSDLSAKARAAEDRATAAEARATAAEARTAPAQPASTAPLAEANAKPTPAQFVDAFEYAEALAEWSAETALAKRDKADADKVTAAERSKVVATWTERMTAAKAETPDFEEMLASSSVSVGDDVRDAIIESEFGPKILYELASDPELAERLGKKSIRAQLVEIGKMEARFEAKGIKPGTAAPAPAPVQRRAAPEPITAVRGSKSADNPVSDDGEFVGTFSEWKAARQKMQRSR